MFLYLEELARAQIAERELKLKYAHHRQLAREMIKRGKQDGDSDRPQPRFPRVRLAPGA